MRYLYFTGNSEFLMHSILLCGDYTDLCLDSELAGKSYVRLHINYLYDGKCH